ncbi:hypothetical protein NECAME_05120 [Necator americanus]|uniref:Uncharacterized protein n=1 Tax=Necator americanus TaxID=51031 RepID=W2SM68_NECAM|nr:hypothetical protein NECAME_05120 [Necator americanus]ETN69797.1 hypothetical protein NECAME_05120 [Necator americanus]
MFPGRYRKNTVANCTIYVHLRCKVAHLSSYFSGRIRDTKNPIMMPSKAEKGGIDFAGVMGGDLKVTACLRLFV